MGDARRPPRRARGARTLPLTWAGGLLARRRARLLAVAAGIAVAVALLAAIGSFLAASTSQMTERAIQRVPLDWQVEAQPDASPASVLRGVRDFPGVEQALPVEFAETTGFRATTGGSTQSTGAGFVLGLPRGYRRTFPEQLRDLAGKGAGVLVFQQTAANLRVEPGDTVEIGRAGLRPASVRVDGIVDLPSIDSLFQKVGAPVGAQPQAPPDNVVLLPGPLWHELFDPLEELQPTLVRHQVHALIDHSFPRSPSDAYIRVGGLGRNLETRLVGTALVGNNLAAAIGKARSDSLYAQVLFLFLGLPGAVLSGLLTLTVAGAGAARRRNEQALLRTRGASTATLVRLALAEAGLVGATGVAAGLLTALLIGKFAFGSVGFGAGRVSAVLWCGGAALAGFAVAAAAIAFPAWRDARSLTVAAARRAVGRASAPWWMRYRIDFLLLAAGIALVWLTSRNGYKLVLAVEGIPQVSVNYYALLGPMLAWIGVGLLIYRVAHLALVRGRGAVGHTLEPVAGGLAGTVAATMTRQRRDLARALTLVALTVAFAASTAIFNATYRQQADVEALLSKGADVVVTESPGVVVGPEEANRLARIDGVASVEPLQHRFAYVGADLQDLYGVRADTIVRAGRLQDAYFVGGSAKELFQRLEQRPDAALVSAETVRDFQLEPNDRINLRLQDGRTKKYTTVPFTYIGVAKKFPSAPSDSFVVANANYVAEKTGTPAVGTFLVQTGSANPKEVAKRIAAVVGTSAAVSDITSKRKIVGSSLTAVELSGLTKVELAFALVLAAAATGLALALGLAERRRTFAIAHALGAKRRQLGSFVWSEATFITAGGLLLGAIGAAALTQMLVKVLSGVFDPAPSTLAIPWTYLVAVTCVAIAAVSLAVAGTLRAATANGVETLRDL